MVSALYPSIRHIHFPVIRPLAFALLSLIGISIGIPNLSNDSTQLNLFGQMAHAQASVQATSVSNSELRSYAMSVLDIENLRQQRSEAIAEILGVGTLPPISCNDPSSISDMGRDVRRLIVEFCDESIAIVQDHDLSINRFNELTEMMRSDEDFYDRIQQELLRLQTDSAGTSQADR